jgi:branched-chain amino acid transport system substrate-binding protein
MNKKMLFVFLVLMAVCCATSFGSVNSVQAKTLKIGAIWGLTGPGSQVQVVMKDAAMLAVEWINGKGGITIDGEKYEIELVVEDNKNTAAGAVSAATKLVHREKVNFITGMIVPFQYQAVQTVTEPKKVILSLGKSPLLSADAPYTFSSTHSFVAPYPGIYDYLLEAYPAVKKIGFTCNDEPGAYAVNKVAIEITKAHHLELLDTVITQFGQKDYYPIWTKVMKDNPDAVDIGINFPDALALNAKHGREMGFKGPIISCGTGDASVILKIMGKDMATDFIYAGFDPRSTAAPDILKEIAALWGAKFNSSLNLDALDGWATVWGLAQAIQKAQSLNTTDVMKTWETMKTIETAWGTGTMGGAKTFGINHMVIAPTPITRLQNGKAEFIRWIQPMIP